jgi:hypothetical protein
MNNRSSLSSIVFSLRQPSMRSAVVLQGNQLMIIQSFQIEMILWKSRLSKRLLKTRGSLSLSLSKSVADARLLRNHSIDPRRIKSPTGRWSNTSNFLILTAVLLRLSLASDWWVDLISNWMNCTTTYSPMIPQLTSLILRISLQSNWESQASRLVRLASILEYKLMDQIVLALIATSRDIKFTFLACSSTWMIWCRSAVIHLLWSR